MAHPSFSTRHPHTGTGGNDPQYSWDPRWGWFQVPTNYTRLYSMSHQHPERTTSHQSSSSMREPSGLTSQHRPIPIPHMPLGLRHNSSKTPSMRTTEGFHPSYPPYTSHKIYSGYEEARRPKHRETEREPNMETGCDVPGAYPSSPCASSVYQEAIPQEHQEQLPKKSRKSRHDASQSPTPGRPIYTGSYRRARHSPRKEELNRSTSSNVIPPVNPVHPSPSNPVSESCHNNEADSHPGTKHRRPTWKERSRGDRTREHEQTTGGYATPPTTPGIPSRRSRNHAGSSHESQEEAGTKAGRSSDRSRDTQEADHVPDDDSETWPSQAPLDREIRNRQNYAQGYRPNFWISAERIQQVVIDDSLWFWLQKSEYGVWNPNHATFLASQPIPVSPPDADYIKRKCIFCEEQKRDVRYFVPICYMQETVKRSRGMPSRVIEEWVVTREPVNNKVACQVCYQQVKVWKAAFLVMRIAAEAR